MIKLLSRLLDGILPTVAVIGLAASAVAIPAWAQEVTSGDDGVVARGGPAPAGEKGTTGAKPDYPEFTEVAKDHSPLLTPEGEAGFLPLHFNKKKDQLLCVIPKKMLEKNFLLANSIAGGPRFAGYMWGSRVVQWHEMGKRIVLIQPDLRYEKPSGKGASPVVDAIHRTYTDRIVLSVPILTRKGGDPVIDLGAIFKKDLANIGRFYGGSMDASLSKWATKKPFLRNVELEVDAALMKGDGGTRALVHYSLVELPDNDYKPREADDRIGYFLTAVKDWTIPHDKDTIFKRYVHRWDVRKAEPDKEVSDVDPDHQITFYIEKTVPVEYRRYVREGILEWNKAFEKAGIRNAIKVEQQTDELHADKDPEDVRYAFFRWIVSGRAFAMGPSLANPLTGQILDADIIFDDSMVRAWKKQYASYGAKSLSAYHDPELDAFLKCNPEWDFAPMHQRLLPESTHFQGATAELDGELVEHLHGEHGYCDYAQGLAHETALARAFIQTTGDADLSRRFLGEMIKTIVTHEVGHTLGLRHNFKASSWKSVEQIAANDDPSVPTCASVMDYVPGLFTQSTETQKQFISQTVGPYDDWAIAYGYRIHRKGSEHESEKELLKAIASRSGEDGLAYATDEDTTYFAPDPLVNRFDNGSDIIEYAKHRMEMVKTLRKDMADWALEDGDSFYKLRNAFDMLLFEYGNSASLASRYVGGQYISRHHKGDPDARPPIEIVPADKQREALEFVLDTVLCEKNFVFDPELLNKLAAGRWSHWGSDAMSNQLTYPIHDRIAAAQRRAMFRLLNPYTLARVYDAEIKVSADEDALTVPEVMDRVALSVWSEIDDHSGGGRFSNREPFISSIRRNLQRHHLSMMLNLVLSRPGGSAPADVHAVASMTLQKLSKRIKDLLKSGASGDLDDFSRAHLEEVTSRIDRALEAKYQL